MSFFSKRNPANRPYHPVFSNFPVIFSTNFRLIGFFLPSLLCFLSFLYLGGLVFLMAAALFLLPAGPAVAATYDVGYQLCMHSDGTVPRKFMRSYKLNFRQGVAAMAILLPFLAIPVMVVIVQTQRPLWLDLCLLLSAFVLMAFSILTFSHIALIEMPLGRILKNALILIPLAGWRSILTAAAQTAFAVLLFPMLAVMILLFIFAGPALLIVWSCHILWPTMEQVIQEESESVNRLPEAN
jgi:uncharacterized membrane protein YesL